MFRTKKIVLPFFVFIFLNTNIYAVTYTVTNTNDAGAGSFRQAIIDANTSVGVADIIQFNLGAAIPYTITACTNFSLTFYDCWDLQLKRYRNIFFADGEEPTRFLNQSVNFTNCFSRSSYSGVLGEAPPLWNCTWGTGTTTSTTCYGGAGNSAASLTNYASVPAGWK